MSQNSHTKNLYPQNVFTTHLNFVINKLWLFKGIKLIWHHPKAMQKSHLDTKVQLKQSGGGKAKCF